VPDKVAADGAGGSTLPSFSGRIDGRTFVFSECVMGVWGATSEHDGQEGVPHMASNQANVPIETIEADYPIRIERYGLVADSGGPGRNRGGLAVLREYRMLADDIFFGVRSDKVIHPPHGLQGGRAGTPASNLLERSGGLRILPAMPTTPFLLQTGEVYRHVMAGGGGFGSALERAPDRVREDVLDGRVSRSHARDAYGVVITADGTLDEEATTALRSRMAPLAATPRPAGRETRA
jgi:N-methylhydantoinase B